MTCRTAAGRPPLADALAGDTPNGVLRYCQPPNFSLKMQIVNGMPNDPPARPPDPQPDHLRWSTAGRVHPLLAPLLAERSVRHAPLPHADPALSSPCHGPRAVQGRRCATCASPRPFNYPLAHRRGQRAPLPGVAGENRDADSSLINAVAGELQTGPRGRRTRRPRMAGRTWRPRRSLRKAMKRPGLWDIARSAELGRPPSRIPKLAKENNSASP
jgi:hypothetical protein